MLLTVTFLMPNGPIVRTTIYIDIFTSLLDGGCKYYGGTIINIKNI